MGLDITAYAFRNGDHFSGTRTEEQFHRWRGHQALLEWCSMLTVARGLPAWDEPAQSLLLDAKELDLLEAAINNGELPVCPEEGESREAWTRCYDLTFVAKARALLAAGFDVEIVASW